MLNSHHYTGGANRLIRDLLDDGSHGLARQYHGRREGWTVHLYSRDMPNILSSNLAGADRFRTSAGLMQAVCGAYGPNRQVVWSR